MSNNKISWATMLDTSTERRRFMKTPLLVIVVTALHVMALAAFISIQGCGTTQPSVEPPAKPVMPPSSETVPPEASVPPPAFRPPAPMTSSPVYEMPAEQTLYTVQKGDSLSKIAKKVGVSTKELADINNIKNPNMIRVGQQLIVPGYASVQKMTEPSRPRRQTTSSTGGAEYVVRKGDTLSGLAVRYGTTVAEIKQANQLSSSMIRVGQKLHMPGAAAADMPTASKKAAEPKTVKEPVAPVVNPAPVPEPAMPEPENEPEEISSELQQEQLSEAYPYKVREGDTLDSIARDFVVFKDDLIRANNLTESSELEPGTTIRIPAMSRP